MRAALVRFWMTQHLLRAPVPLTGDRALRPDTPWQRDTWMPAFLSALADEAADALDRLVALERAWRAARRAVAGPTAAFARRRRGGYPGGCAAGFAPRSPPGSAWR